MGSTRSWSLRLRIALSMATAPQSFILSAPEMIDQIQHSNGIDHACQPATLFACVNGSEAPFAPELNLTTIRCKYRCWRRRKVGGNHQTIETMLAAVEALANMSSSLSSRPARHLRQPRLWQNSGAAAMFQGGNE